jgi:hypothetical protein
MTSDKTKILPVNQIDFSDPAIMKSVLSLSQSIFREKSINEAFWLSKNLENYFREKPEFEQRHSELYKQYQEIIKQAKIVGLNMQHVETVEEVIEKDLMRGLIFEHESFWNRLEDYLICHHPADLEQRDVLKERFRKALLGNEEVLTDQSLEWGKEGADKKKHSPTIANWLKYYNHVMGTEVAEDIKLAKFFAEDKEVNRLDEDDKELIRALTELYEHLKISSQTPEGTENRIGVLLDDGRLFMYQGDYFEELKKDEVNDLYKTLNEKGILEKLRGRDGQPEDLSEAGQEKVKAMDSHPKIISGSVHDSSRKPSQIPKQVRDDRGEVRDDEGGVPAEVGQPVEMSGRRTVSTGPVNYDPYLKKYQSFLASGLIKDAERMALRQAQAKQVKQDGYKMVAKMLYDGINGVSLEKALAALKVLAETGSFRKFFSGDKRYQDFFKSYLAKHSGKDKVGDFANDPASAVFLGQFLQSVFERKFNLSSEMSAMLGLYLANLANEAGEQEYYHWAYFDATDRQFKWST